MKKIMLADLIKNTIKDEIELLLEEVDSGKISLEAAQERAWVIYRYPEGGSRGSSHIASHGTLFRGESETTISVSYSPIFESLGDTLDDTPYWEVYINIDTSGSYSHHYEGYADNKELEAIQALEETDSVMQWFNQYCGDHRYR